MQRPLTISPGITHRKLGDAETSGNDYFQAPRGGVSPPLLVCGVYLSSFCYHGAAQSTREASPMKMNPYVNFAGKCAEAFRYYEKYLGGKIGMMMTFSQAPDQTNIKPELKDNVLHARITIAGVELMGSDGPNAQPMRSAYLSLSVESDAEAERIYAALSDGGEILMPIQETFFASRFGQTRDRFGINWMILHERPMPPHN
jgi:PhnB protein